MLEYRTAGESHGKGIIALVSGLPAGLAIDFAFIDAELARRQQGPGSGPRMAIEQDRVEILSGVRWRMTLGSPIVGLIRNRDYQNWISWMDPEGTIPDGYQEITVPRPGHADLGGMLKYRFRDIRNVIERSSARETAGRCFAGALAKLFLASFGVIVGGFVEAVGETAAPPVEDFQTGVSRASQSTLRTYDPTAEVRMTESIEQARAAGETLGGVFVVAAFGVMPGLGGYAQASERLDGRIAQAMMSIPAVKGVEIGDAFRNARVPGSRAHDQIIAQPDRRPLALSRLSSHAGGIEG
ncbi:MAG TPA: chorismate synthase, partial [Atribacteraceae bacterium]|nr:chorismate synthase [Atribacteraceae bacterium]